MNSNIGLNIRFLRERDRMTQLDLAKAIGASDKAISAWESGRREPKMGYVSKIAEFFNVTISSLLDSNYYTLPAEASKSARQAENLQEKFERLYAPLTEEQRQVIDQTMEALLKKK